MRTEHVFCDRCKKEIINGSHELEYAQLRISSEKKIYSYDLCDNCARVVKHFIEYP